MFHKIFHLNEAEELAHVFYASNAAAKRVSYATHASAPLPVEVLTKHVVECGTYLLRAGKIKPYLGCEYGC